VRRAHGEIAAAAAASATNMIDWLGPICLIDFRSPKLTRVTIPSALILNASVTVYLYLYKGWVGVCAVFFKVFMALLEQKWTPESSGAHGVLCSSWLRGGHRGARLGRARTKPPSSTSRRAEQHAQGLLKRSQTALNSGQVTVT